MTVTLEPDLGGPRQTIRKSSVVFVQTKIQPPLGADTWVNAQIIRELDRSTHELYAACATGPADAPTPTYQVLSGIPDLSVHPVDFGYELYRQSVGGKLRALAGSVRTISSLAGLRALIRRRQVQIIHTTDRPRDALASVLLARWSGAKCLIHVHVAYGAWMHPLLKWSLKRADGLIAVSGFVARTLIESGHDPAKIHVVLNGIDPWQWQPGAGRAEVRREFNVDDRAPLLITVCRLFPAKGPDQLIRCLPALLRSHPGLKLMIVGEEMVAGYRQHLVDLAHELGVGAAVLFTGQRSDVPRLMAAADIFAMPSLGEPFGLVFLEAMAMQLPVVALDSGGAPEVVEDGITGFLIEPGDTDGLTSKLLALLEDPKRRQGMGAAGRQRVEARFTTARMAADTARVYRRLTVSNERAADRGLAKP